jgi:hypothetical protein
MSSLVPGGELAPSPVETDFEYYYDQAREICRRVQNRAHLTDDEIIVLAVVASQLALAKYVEPGERDSDATLTQIMGVLDHQEIVSAVSSKMDRLLEGQRGPAREDAPSGKDMKELDLCNDPDEPASDTTSRQKHASR